MAVNTVNLDREEVLVDLEIQMRTIMRRQGVVVQLRAIIAMLVSYKTQCFNKDLRSRKYHSYSQTMHLL